MLDLTAGFNAHPFAQKIKLAHPETTGQMQASPQRQEAHQLEEEEEMKRENWSVLQRVHPGKRKGEKSGVGQLSSFASLTSHSHRKSES